MGESHLQDATATFLCNKLNRLNSLFNAEDVLDGIDVEMLKPAFPPWEDLPCANVEAEKYKACDKPGKMACSACKLVSYCSKECQQAHWRTHKQDCKNRMRSNNWKPAWITQGRSPTFLDKNNMSTADEFQQTKNERLSVGLSLWGNIPATDIINLSGNENDPSRDLCIAFAASGDIRHLTRTINALGPDYTGRLTIILNDLSPHIVSRNLVSLLILGTVDDEAIAADMALHLWYSVFMPIEYRIRSLALVSDFFQQTSSGQVHFVKMGNNSHLTCVIPGTTRDHFQHMVGPTISLKEARSEYDRVRIAPSRLDFRDRMYLGLKPSHRVAFQQFRRHGVILPFGAINVHFNAPNPSLFSEDGEWLLTDYADPLGGWDLDEIVQSGRKHGAQPEDIYGCLYFFLSDQLRLLARRIRELRISFYVFNTDACAIPKTISSGSLSIVGIPLNMRFDRVDVSNILDLNYVGIQDVLNSWGPVLAESDKAAIIGYLMNWVVFQEKGRVVDAGKMVFLSLSQQMVKEGKVLHCTDPTTAMMMTMGNVDALYDNSKAFSKFLKKQGLDSMLQTVKLRLRDKHTIFPHRIKALLKGKPGDLPKFSDDETWYRYTQLVNYTFTERFVEFVRA